MTETLYKRIAHIHKELIGKKVRIVKSSGAKDLENAVGYISGIQRGCQDNALLVIKFDDYFIEKFRGKAYFHLGNAYPDWFNDKPVINSKNKYRYYYINEVIVEEDINPLSDLEFEEMFV